MKMRLNLKLSLASILALTVIVGFQNCGEKFSFNSNIPGNSVLVATATPNSNQISCPDGSTPLLDAANPCPTATGTPTPRPTSTTNPPGAVDVESVECEIGWPNNKVSLSSDLQSGSSNGQSTRICMSENACLNIINTYAEARNCQLSLGSPTSNMQTACTKVFPGSEGTCKNAQPLTDDDVTNLLNKMSVQK